MQWTQKQFCMVLEVEIVIANAEQPLAFTQLAVGPIAGSKQTSRGSWE